MSRQHSANTELRTCQLSINTPLLVADPTARAESTDFPLSIGPFQSTLCDDLLAAKWR
jgi:hypothetical protein